jgi:hypothetical protein
MSPNSQSTGCLAEEICGNVQQWRRRGEDGNEFRLLQNAGNAEAQVSSIFKSTLSILLTCFFKPSSHMRSRRSLQSARLR